MMHGGGGDDEQWEENEEDKVNEELNESRKSYWKGCFKLWQNGVGVDQSTSWIEALGREAEAVTNAGFGLLHQLIIHPDNWWYQLWTQFILIWAVYSSFFTPLEFGFFRGLPENLFLLDIAGQIAFLIDIVVHFFVAFRDPQSLCLVSNRNSIALRYLKSSFLVDFLGCLPWDAIYRACGRKEPVRYLLWIRLSRVYRVTEFFEKLEKDIRINYLFVRIVKLLVVELYCTHTAACIFYYLATTLPPSQEGYTWIGSLKMGDYSYSHFRDIDLWKRYITSLYFAIVTMATVGYGEIHAVNIREMIFIMIYVSFDMILGAYLLGNMTALIVKGSKTERFRDRMADLIKYMNRNKLGKDMSKNIKDHVRLQYERSYTEAAVLQDIPVSIRAEIAEKLYKPIIEKVPLFNGCSSAFIKEIAIKVREEFFLPGEVIIEKGNAVDQLYFVCGGELEEVIRGEEADSVKSVIRLRTYSSFGEVSLLCNMPQPYTIKVQQFCKLLRLDKQSLVDILEIYFCDGRIILNNLLQGRESSLQKKLQESDIILHVGKHELELAMRVNFAAYTGDLYRLKHLIEAGADPNKTDYNGRSPLHLAASKGYEEITLYLIQQGVNINVPDICGNTPLLEAIKNGHDEVASLLVNAGASLTIDDAGNCLCMAVARRDSHFLERVLAYGINPNAKNYDLRTPLHLAASEGLYSMTNLLLEAGANVLSKDRWGSTPLHEAHIGGNRNLINLLQGATTAQLSEFHDCSQGLRGKMQQGKCTVFPFHPWDSKEERKLGVVIWIPATMEKLIKTATDLLKFSHGSGSCIVSEDGGKILDVNMIIDGQKLFLVSEA